MSKLKGELKQVLLKPASVNKDGKRLHPQYAALNINVPILTPEDEKEVAKLFLALEDGEIVMSINPINPRLFSTESENE